MATWMLYGILAAALLSMAGWLAERGLMHLGRPSRWLWLLVMTASAGWPFVSSAVRQHLRVHAASGGVGGPLPHGRDSVPRWLSTGGDVLAGVPDEVLVGAWCLCSGLVLVALLLSSESLKEDRRRWQNAKLAGESVFLSGSLGPAVIGAIQPRIVLPRWVLEMDEEIQKLIVRHEREHVRAGDSRLLLASLSLLVVLPWCLPLWWQFRRLRLAIETDCDMRLLRRGAPARAYAHALLAVADRRRRAVFPLAGMALPKSTLERRLRLIAAGPPVKHSRSAIAVFGAAVLLSAGTTALPLPEPPLPAGLTAPFRSQMAPGVEPSPYGPPRPDGSLPGDPGQARLAAEIRAHHSAVVASGIPEESVFWFVVDRSGEVVHTGIDQGTEQEVTTRLRNRHPTETSDAYLAWSDVAVGPSHASVLWLLPPP